MTEPNLDEQIDEILAKFAIQILGQFTGATALGVDEFKAKDTIKALIADEVKKARYNCNSDPEQPNDVHIKFYNEGYKSGYIDRGIEELQSTLGDKEQSNGY